MSDVIVNDEPENVCFGCSPHNERGLQLKFERLPDGQVQTTLHAESQLAGAPGIIHGGIQATILDEVLEMAIQTAYPDEKIHAVTVDFRLRYRRPARTGEILRVRGRVMSRHEGRFTIEGEILDQEDCVLTRAEACWYQIDGSL